MPLLVALSTPGRRPARRGRQGQQRRRNSRVRLAAAVGPCHGGCDRFRVWPDDCACDQDGRRCADAGRGGACGHVWRPVQVGRIGQAVSERRAGEPHGTAEAGEFSVAQPGAAFGWLVDEQRMRVIQEPPLSAAQPDAAAARVE